MLPYIYHQSMDQYNPGNTRIWLAGTDRAGVFRTAAPFSVSTDDPETWLADHQAEALDRIEVGRASIVRTSTGHIKQLDKREAIAWQEIRAERKDRLYASDWTRTAPHLSKNLRESWADYQQRLRDLPETYASPYDVVWPDEPAD